MECDLKFGGRAVGALLHPTAASVVPERLTFVAASRPHARLKVLCVRTGNAQVQLGLQHPLSHPLALFARGRAAGGPRRPVGVDAGLWSIICSVIK